jgi:hypothetical protein
MLQYASQTKFKFCINRWSVKYPNIQVKMENSLAVPEFTVRNLTVLRNRNLPSSTCTVSEGYFEM